MGLNSQQNGLSLAAPGYYSFGMLIHQWNHVVPMLWGNHHYDRCALKVLSGTNVCRFLLFRASMVRVPAHSCSGTRKYLGALRRVNPERTSSPQLIVIRWHHLEISPHTFKPASSDAILHPWKPILEAFDEGPESFRIRVTFFDEARHVVGPTLWLFRGRWSFT